jgi:hypothetical protein
MGSVFLRSLLCSSCYGLSAPLVLPLSLSLCAGAREIHALFDDGRVYKVTPVAADAESDIAIGRIVAPPGTKFKPLRIGRAAALRRGDILVVLGAPLGGSLVPTVGSLSGARYVGDDEIMSYVLNSRTDWNLLACDASFSSGNSGGPVVNADGEVVGVAVMVRTAGNPMEVRCCQCVRACVRVQRVLEAAGYAGSLACTSVCLQAACMLACMRAA